MKVAVIKLMIVLYKYNPNSINFRLTCLSYIQKIKYIHNTLRAAKVPF